MIQLVESPKQKRAKLCSECNRKIGLNEPYYVKTVEIGGGIALEEYCMECVKNNMEVRNG